MIVGALLGIVFGASSLYLVLKVGLTVSASIPVAVLSITLFRLFSRLTGFRQATILENNIIQTTGSAGESIAFGVGVTMPALFLLGFEMDVTRVMTVGVLGGLLGILMMIPLRRAFIVKQHGKLKYPEGTACADVLIVGEQGGASAKAVFTGFGLAFVYAICMKAFRLWTDTLNVPLYREIQGGRVQGLNKGVLGGELDPGVARRRLHHRPADRVDHGGRRRAGVSGVRAGDRVFRWRTDGTARPGGVVSRQGRGQRRADQEHGCRRHPQQLHHLHRRRGGRDRRNHLDAPGAAASSSGRCFSGLRDLTGSRPSC